MTDGAATADDPAGWKRLEPASLVINLLPDLWRTLLAGWPLLLALVMRGGVAELANLLVLAGVLASSLARTGIHFATLRYRYADGKLQIESGLFGRRHRVIDPARIQNLELVQNVFHRAFHLVELRVETAGETGRAGLLSALSVAEAEALRAALQRSAEATRAARATPTGEPPAELEEIERTGLVEVLGHGVTQARAGAAMVVYGLSQEILPTLYPAFYLRTLSRPGAGPILLLVFLSAGFVWSVVGSFVRHYGFVLSRTPVGLRTVAGLFTRRRVEVPAGKVQLVRIDASWLRRLMGYASLQIETAGSNALPGEDRVAEASVPMVPDALVPFTLDAVLPGYAASDAVPWRPAAPAARVRLMLEPAARWGALAWLFGRYVAPSLGLSGLAHAAPSAVTAVVFALAGALAGWADAQASAWKRTPTLLVVRQGFFSRVTVVLPRAKVQSVRIVQGPVQRVLGLWRVHVRVAGGRAISPELDEHDARALFRALGG